MTNFDDHGCDREGCPNKTKRVFMDDTVSTDNPNGYYVKVRGVETDLRQHHFLLFCSLECTVRFWQNSDGLVWEDIELEENDGPENGEPTAGRR